MSDQVMKAELELTASVRDAEKVKALKSDLDGVLKTLKEITKINIPANLTGKIQSKTAVEAVNTMKAKAEAAGKLAGAETKASRQRRADTRAEAGERQAFDAADMAALRAKFGFRARMQRQRAGQDAAADRQRRAADAAMMKGMRERVAMIGRASRERIAAIREGERAQARADAIAERDADAATRRRLAGERLYRTERDRTRREVVSRGREGFTRARDAVREVTRPPAALAAVGAAGAAAGTRRVLRAEADVDSAEIGTRQYGGLDAKAARALRDKWASPLAEALGVETPKLLSAWTDAVKLGIPTTGAEAFAELSTKTSEAWGVGFETVVDTFGTVNTLLTSKGAAFDAGKLKSVANTLQHLAAKQSTTPEKLIGFLKRGAGGADLLGMSMEGALAFGSASTSLGNRSGESGSLLDFIAGRIVEMPRLVKKKGDEGKQARELVSALGYGSASAMEAKRRQDPESFLPDFIDRFNKIKDQRKQEQSIRFAFGREWLGEASRLVKGADTYREAVKLQKEAKGLDAIGAVWDLHKLKLSFVFKQLRAGILNVLGEFGKVLSPMARQAGDVFLAWSAKLRSGGLAARFKASIAGFIEGLGFSDLPDMLRRVLGEPGEGSAGAISAWKATFREFGAGISDVVGSIKAAIGAFTGGDPEVIARWTGRIAALSVALVALGPVLGILGGLISGIVAIASAAASIAAASKLAGLGAGAGATGIAGLVPRLIGGMGLAIIAGIGANRVEISAWMIRVGKSLFQAIWSGLIDAIKSFSNDGFWTGLKNAIIAEIKPSWMADADREARERKPEDRTAPVDKDKAHKDWWEIDPTKMSYRHRGFDRSMIRGASYRSGGEGAGTHQSALHSAAFSPLNEIARNTKRGGVRPVDPSMVDVAGRLMAVVGNTRQALDRAVSVGGGVAMQNGGAGFGPSGFPRAPGVNVPGWYGRGGGSAGAGAPNENFTGTNAEVLKQAAASLGTSPKDLATVISYETAGKFSPSIRGGKGGNYQGLIQFGPAERAKYGVTGNESFAEQMPKVVAFLKDRGFKAGMGLDKLYSTINGGNPYVSQGASDGNGTIAQHVARMQAQHGARAEAFLGSGSGGQAITPGAAFGASAKAVEAARGLLGSGSSQAAAALGSRMTPGQWCADFVNGALKSSGIRGVNNSIANSFMGWGKQVLDGAKAGDVLVEHRGRGIGQTGGHAGLATGQVQHDARTGRDFYEMISGNHGGRVGRSWVDASKVAVRRAVEATEAAADSGSPQQTDGGFRSTGWRKAETPSDAASRVVAKPTPADLAGQAAQPRPVRVFGSDGAIGGGLGSGNGTTVHAPVTIHAGAQSPSEIAGNLQRHVSEARNFRTHDMEPELV